MNLKPAPHRDLFSLTAILALLLLGCGEMPNEPTSSEAAPTSPPPTTSQPVKSEEPESVVTAPLDYVSGSIRAGENARGKLETAAIQKAIEAFQQQEGRYPQSLEELVQQAYLPSLPRPPVKHRFQYDSSTGSFSIVPE